MRLSQQFYAFLRLFILFFGLLSGLVQAQPAVNGTIGTNEYGTHTNGQNQQQNGGQTVFMTWDNSNLYVAVTSANTAEALVLYLDKDPQVPVNGGTNSNGTLVGFNYDNTNFAQLPFRADLVLYVKDGYREYRTANGSNGWSAQTTAFGSYASNAGTREFSIPWSAIGGLPAGFNWFSYVTSSSGHVYGQVPEQNQGGPIGTSARYERYYTVSNTTGTPTPPFSRNSYVFNSASSNNSFGAINVFDFTMNASGLQITRLNSGGDWNISGTLVVADGSVFFGSGGSNYGQTTVNNVDIRGGTLNMDQTNKLMRIDGNLTTTGGTLNLSNTSGGDLDIRGNWSQSGTATLNANNRAVFLRGSGTQSITRPAANNTFPYLLVDKTGGAVQLGSNINVSELLTFTSSNTAHIITGSHVLAVTKNTTGAISYAGSGYVSGNLSRAIATGSGNYLFPIGTGNGYTPVSANFSTVSTGGSLLASSHNDTAPNFSSIGLSNTKYINRYWALTPTGMAGYTCAATFTYLSGDVAGGASNALLKSAHFNSTWSYPTTSTSGMTFTAQGLNAFGDFMAAECDLSASVDPMSNQCEGNNVTFTTNVSGAGNSSPSFSWVGPGGFTATVQNPTVNNVTTAQSGTYTVTVTGVAGCTATATVSLVVDAANTAGAPSTTPTLCVNTALTPITHTTTGATGIGSPTGLPPGVTASWASNTITISGTPTATGTFNYSIPLTGGCGSVSATGVITVTSAPTVVNQAYERCSGEQWGVALPGSSNSTVITSYRVKSLSAATGLTKIYSDIPNPVAGSLAAAITLPERWSNSTSGTLDVVYTFDAMGGGCYSSEFTVTVGIKPNPATPITGADFTTVTCTNPTATLTPNGSGFAWSGGSHIVTPTVSTTYTVTVTGANGCTATSTIQVTVDKVAPSASASASPATVNCTTPSSDLTASGGGSYTWNTGATTATITVTPNATTTYTVTVTGANGCTASSTVSVTVAGVAPNLSLTVNNPTCTSLLGSIVVNNHVAGNTYKLNNGAFGTSTTFSNLTAGTYTVTVKDASGCESSQTVQLVNPITSCPIPTINAQAQVSGNAVTFTWSNGCYKRYRIQYRRRLTATTATPWALVLIPANQTTYTLQPLVPGTYQWGVRGDCTITNIWTDPAIGLQFVIP